MSRRICKNPCEVCDAREEGLSLTPREVAQVEDALDNPTPIDPADIRPGDVVERALIDRITVTQHEGWAIRGCREDGSKAGLGILGPECVTTTWHLVNRPDPDAEVIEAIAKAIHKDGFFTAWDEIDEIAREQLRSRARAALAAIREHDAKRAES